MQVPNKHLDLCISFSDVKKGTLMLCHRSFPWEIKILLIKFIC